MAIGDRRFMGLVVAIVFLCIGVAVLGWANYSLGESSDKRYAAIARRVDDLSRANGIKDQQLEQAGIPPSPLLAPTTTTTTTAAPEVTRTTTMTGRTPTTAATRSSTTAATAPPTTSAPSTTAAPATTTTTRPPPSTTTTTRPCIVPVTIRPGGCP